MAAEATFDVLIVGAGACGATTAYFLSKEGVKTGLLDQGHGGREASWASAGMIGPRSSPPRDPWFLEATITSRQLYDRLAVELPEQTGSQFGYGGEGALLVARTGVELELLDEAAGPPHPAVPRRRLDAREAREREPALPGDVTGAVWCPEDRFLDARRYTATVLQAAVLRGVHLLEGVRVTRLEWDGDRVIGVRAADRCWHAGTVINTAGAWAGGIDPRLTHPVYPDHGQIMAVQGPPRGLRHNLSRVGAEGYATPRPDGRVISAPPTSCGGTRRSSPPTGSLSWPRPWTSCCRPCATPRAGDMVGAASGDARRPAHRGARSAGARRLPVGRRPRLLRHAADAGHRAGARRPDAAARAAAADSSARHPALPGHLTPSTGSVHHATRFGR